VPPAPRLTLASLARARGLNPALLRRLGWTERAGGVAIPWPTTTGRPAWHLRHCLDPQPGRPRWTWTGFDRTTLLPYLSPFLPHWRRRGQTQVVVLESETDAVVVAESGRPALATGGADNWQGRWWDLLKEFSQVIVWLEDGGSLRLLQAVWQSRPADGPAVLVAHNLGGPKDPGRLVAAQPAPGQARLRQCLDQAVPVTATADLQAALVTRLQAERQPGGSYSARCPFHDDRHPSLSIFKGDDGHWAFRCHAGACGVGGSLTLLGAALGLVESPPTLLETTQPDIPDSRSYNTSGIGKASPSALVRCWEQPEPEARAWVLPLVPDGAVTVFYGDAGVCKTWLAIHLATCVAAGRPWLDQPVRRRPVLYLDAELDAPEFLRRAYRVARGLGLEGPPEGLHYFALPGPLTHPAVFAEVETLVHSLGEPLVILDSLSVACAGADLERQAVATDLMQRLRSLGTVLVLDHIPKPQPGVPLHTYRPFGSQFKYALGRSVVQVLAAENGPGLVLRQTKSTFGPKAEPLALALTFTNQVVTITRTALSAPELAGVAEHLPALEKVAQALEESADGATPEQLAQDLGMSPKTVRNHLSALRLQGRAEPTGGGRWQALQKQTGTLPQIPTSLRAGTWESLSGRSEEQPARHSRFPDSLGTGNRESQPGCFAGAPEKAAGHSFPIPDVLGTGNRERQSGGFGTTPAVGGPAGPTFPMPNVSGTGNWESPPGRCGSEKPAEGGGSERLDRARLTAAVLEAAEQRGYPELAYKPGHTLLSGEEGWKKFVRWVALDELPLVLRALESLPARVPEAGRPPEETGAGASG
jgi:biotin operon repressor